MEKSIRERRENFLLRSGEKLVEPFRYAGQMQAGEPGGSDLEVFYDFGAEHNKDFGENCHQIAIAESLWK